MNTSTSVTQQVIAFLSQPDLPFGAEEGLLLLSDPIELQKHVVTLLEENPSVLDGDGEELESKLTEADCPLIAQEFRVRVGLVATFFNGDAQAVKAEA